METSPDSLRMATIKKFFHVLSHQMVDTSSQPVLIEPSSSGMLKVNANILLRITFTKIGFQKLGIFQSQARAALLANTLPQSDGMDILKSGTIRPSTLKIPLKLTKPTSTHLPFLLEETLLSLEEKI